MKTGKTLTELAQEIDRQRVAKQDYLATTDQLEVTNDTQLAIPAPSGIRRMPINDIALGQIGDRVGIPSRYLDKMRAEAPALLASNVNHWFRAAPQRRMIRTLDGTARAFLSDVYQRTDNYDVANTVLPIFAEFGKDLRFLSCEITDRRLYIKVSLMTVTGEVTSRRRGDMVEAGVMISNSEVGLGATTVTPFANFLVCTNGMTREGGKRWAHIGKRAVEQDGVVVYAEDTRKADDRAQLLMIRDTLKTALDASTFHKWIAKVQGTTTEKITGDVPKAVELLAESLDLREHEQQSVLRHLIDGGDISRYGLMNAVTRTAEDAQSYDRATELEALGARVLDLAPREWSRMAEAA